MRKINKLIILIVTVLSFAGCSKNDDEKMNIRLEKAAKESCTNISTEANSATFDELKAINKSGGGLASYCFGYMNMLSRFQTNDETDLVKSPHSPLWVKFFSTCDSVEITKSREAMEAGGTRLLMCNIVNSPENLAYCQNLLRKCESISGGPMQGMSKVILNEPESPNVQPTSPAPATAPAPAQIVEPTPTPTPAPTPTQTSVSEPVSVVSTPPSSVPEQVPGREPESPSVSGRAPAATANPVAAADNSPFTPSFDCAKASNGQEKMVCSDRDLAKLDVEASQAYGKAREKSADKDTLKKEQLNWIKFSLRACSDKTCLTEVYKKRILELQ